MHVHRYNLIALLRRKFSHRKSLIDIHHRTLEIQLPGCLDVDIPTRSIFMFEPA
jgi:hypothetical protein